MAFPCEIPKSHICMGKKDEVVAYQVKCHKCGYVWRTRYPKIPARCPACNVRIYGTDNYSVPVKYVKGRCWIATAVYGTPLANEVDLLVDFRDNHLLTNYVGKTIVEFYYKVSPPIAELIRRNKALRLLARYLLSFIVSILKNHQRRKRQ